MALRSDLAHIASLLPSGARVLDVGCGDGALLAYLANAKGADARGIELSQEGVNHCVAKGLSVIQGDADTDLSDYPDRSFDFAILSQTIQATQRPKAVLGHLLRIANRTIVSFPNFGFWKVRLQLALTGRMPVTKQLTHAWHETPNIHLCSIADFAALTEALGARIERAAAVSEEGAIKPMAGANSWDNLFAASAVFMLAPRGSGFTH